jgi:GNAT superfamily N-acetyltransferase
MKYETPLDNVLVEELFGFWKSLFEGDSDLPRNVFLGSEVDHHRLIVHLTRREARIAGTSVLVTSTAIPLIGALGEVATQPDCRGQGIATRLCQQIVSDFREAGGEALFLGTINPAAARVYHRLGWRKLAGAAVMANITSGDSPEAFLVDFFREPSPVTIFTAGPAVRVPMIPLLHTPHDWQVLDANAAMYSTRYDLQESCLGLYRRYQYVVQDHRGGWFAAFANDGRVVGLSTARLDDSGRCNVDGFAHQRFMNCWNGLMQAAIGWGESHNATTFTATLSTEDEDKQSLFEAIGFQGEQPTVDIEVGGRRVKSVQLQRR